MRRFVKRKKEREKDIEDHKLLSIVSIIEPSWISVPQFRFEEEIHLDDTLDR